jgi:hypothetical protein
MIQERENVAMGEVMTVSEIEDKFKSEWILIGDPETNEALEVLAGKVLWHSKNRDEVYRKVRELKPRHSAIVYTGPVVPEGTAAAL